VSRLVGQSVVLFSRSVAGSWNRLVVVLLDGGLGGSLCRTFSASVRQSFAWLVRWLADGWWVDWSVHVLVGGLDGVGWLVGWLGECVGEFVGLWVGWLSGG
jgi:hypothetical protein